MVAWAILQEARRRANVTQQELAEAAGRPQSTISKIERGRRDPTLTTLQELVRAAGFDLRLQLVPPDEHDRQLIDAVLALSPQERLAALEEQAEPFIDVAVSRPKAILDVLERHRVRYVVIGGIGARIWGSPRNTDDLDICPAETRANKRRLAAALTELGARYRPPGLEGGWDERSFDSMVSLELTTELGWVDVWFRPDGTEGYEDLIHEASDASIGELTVKVADLDDIIRSKAAAGRNKDLGALDHLRELQRRRDELGREKP